MTGGDRWQARRLQVTFGIAAAALSLSIAGWLWLERSHADHATLTSEGQRRGVWMSGKECFEEALTMQLQCSKQTFWQRPRCRDGARSFVRSCLEASLHAGEVCLPPQKPARLCGDSGELSDDCLTLAERALEACHSFPEMPLTCRQQGASSRCLVLEATGRNQPKLCDLEPSPRDRDDCITAVARETRRPQLCAAGLTATGTLDCYELVFQQLDSPAACARLEFPALAERCLQRVFEKSTNREDCAQLRELESASRCYTRVAYEAKDPELCAHVALPDKRDNCYATLGACERVERRERFRQCRLPARLRDCTPTPSAPLGFFGTFLPRPIQPSLRGPEDCWQRAALDVKEASLGPLSAARVAQVCDALDEERRDRCLEELIAVTGNVALCDLERDPFLRMRCRAERSDGNPCRDLSTRYLPYCVTTYERKLDDPLLCKYALNIPRREACRKRLQR